MEEWMIKDVQKKIELLTSDKNKFTEKHIKKIYRITEWALME